MSRNADDILNELLVMRAQRGDTSALQLLVRRWHPRLICHARKLTEREDVAADVVQEVWVAIIRGLHRLEDPATFRGWIYRIVQNKSVDWIRSQTRERKLNRDIGQQIPSPTARKPPDESNDVQQLRNAMTRLTAEQQLLLRMFYGDQMPLAEIAAVLDVPVGTLKFRLFSLRQQLKKMIEREKS
jgi:RNA polymerase sigma factor (sigma-70 family)